MASSLSCLGCWTPLLACSTCVSSDLYLTSLWEWLRHSNKSPVCELCNTPYKITKLYSPNMPARVPIRLLIEKLAVDYLHFLKYFLRSIVVGFLWLIIMPLAASIVVRMINSFAEAFPYERNKLLNPRLAVSSGVNFTRKSSFVSIPEPLNSVSPDFVKNIMIDVVEGSVVVASILLVFFVIMIVREWVLQNQQLVEYLRELDRLGDLEHMRWHDQHHAARAEIAAANRERILRLRELELQALNEIVIGHNDQENHGNVNIDFMNNIPDAADLANDDLLAAAVAANDINDDEVDGLQDLLGFMGGPLSSMIKVHLGALIAIVVQLGLFYLFPYSVGRILAYLSFNGLFPAIFSTIMELATQFTIVASWISTPIYHLITAVLGDGWTLRMSSPTSFFASCLLEEVPFLKSNICAAIDNAVLTFQSLLPRSIYSVDTHGSAACFAEMFRELLTSDRLSTRFWFTMLGYAAIMFVISKIIIPLAEMYRHIAHYRFLLRILVESEVIGKVVFILSIELLSFPIFCGILLKFSILPVFETISIPLMIESDMSRPVLSIFLYWVMGTSYMFLFTLFVTMCRKIMRPGVLFFLRDSNDPDYKPIDDMLEKGLFVQLGKIGISAVLYAIIIVMGIGAVTLTVRLQTFLNVFPIKSLSLLNTGELQSSSQLERSKLALVVLFVIVLQSCTKDISLFLHAYWKLAFKHACRVTRLTSFLLGETAEAEMGQVYFGNIYSRALYITGSLLPDFKKPLLNSIAVPKRGLLHYILSTHPEIWFVKDGTHVRAPALDSLKGNKRRGLFVPVTELDEHEMPSDVPEDDVLQPSDYTVVYRPPAFRVKVALFIVLLWVNAVVLNLVLGLGPLLLGRIMLFFTGIEELQAVSSSSRLLDLLFSWAIGGVVAGPGALLIRWHIQKLSDSIDVVDADSSSKIAFTYELLRKFGLVTFATVVVPCVLGIILDQYALSPVGNVLTGFFDEDAQWSAVMFSTQSTAGTLFSVLLYQRNQLPAYLFLHTVFGFVCLIITKGVLHLLRPNAQILADYEVLVANGIWNLDQQVLFTRLVTASVIRKAVGLLFVPPMYAVIGVLIGIRQLAPLVLCQWSYPIAVIMFMHFQVSKSLAKMKRGWETAVRDKLYLIGQRLENVES